MGKKQEKLCFCLLVFCYAVVLALSLSLSRSLAPALLPVVPLFLLSLSRLERIDLHHHFSHGLTRLQRPHRLR